MGGQGLFHGGESVGNGKDFKIGHLRWSLQRKQKSPEAKREQGT